MSEQFLGGLDFDEFDDLIENYLGRSQPDALSFEVFEELANESNQQSKIFDLKAKIFDLKEKIFDLKEKIKKINFKYTILNISKSLAAQAPTSDEACLGSPLS